MKGQEINNRDLQQIAAITAYDKLFAAIKDAFSVL